MIVEAIKFQGKVFPPHKNHLELCPPVPNHYAMRIFMLVRSGGAPPFVSRQKVERKYTEGQKNILRKESAEQLK